MCLYFLRTETLAIASLPCRSCCDSNASTLVRSTSSPILSPLAQQVILSANQTARTEVFPTINDIQKIPAPVRAVDRRHRSAIMNDSLSCLVVMDVTGATVARSIFLVLLLVLLLSTLPWSALRHLKAPWMSPSASCAFQIFAFPDSSTPLHPAPALPLSHSLFHLLFPFLPSLTSPLFFLSPPPTSLSFSPDAQVEAAHISMMRRGMHSSCESTCAKAAVTKRRRR